MSLLDKQLQKYGRQQTEGFARHFLHFHLPNQHVAHGRVGISAGRVGVMTHHQVQGTALFGQVRQQAHATAAHHAARLHAVAARHLRVHPHQFMPLAEGDADTRTLLCKAHLAARRAGMQVNGAVGVCKVHGHHVGRTFIVRQAHHAIRTFFNDGLHLGTIGQVLCFHR